MKCSCRKTGHAHGRQSTTVRRRRRMMIKGGLEGWKMGRTKFPQPSGIPYQNTNFNNA